MSVVVVLLDLIETRCDRYIALIPKLLMLTCLLCLLFLCESIVHSRGCPNSSRRPVTSRRLFKPRFLVCFHPQHNSTITMSDKKLPEYVTLVSSDGFEFVVRRSAAVIAKTLDRMFDPASKSLLPTCVAEDKFLTTMIDGFQESIERRCLLESIT
jgi:hypothetical protein